jgi:hypothetical protein
LKSLSKPPLTNHKTIFFNKTEHNRNKSKIQNREKQKQIREKKNETAAVEIELPPCTSLSAGNLFRRFHVILLP